MSELPDNIKDLALILVVAGIVTIVFKRLKQPLVLGYIVAGFVVSPHMPYTMSVVDRENIQTWADIGVIFLLFSLGLDFSFKKILRMGVSPIIATSTIIFCMMLSGVLVGNLFGWARMDCLFLGGMLAMSSTTIIYKAFDDLGMRQQHFANVVMSVLILEDILAIVMMVMLAAVAGGNNPDGGQMLGSVGRIGFFLILWFVVGIFAIPLFLRSVRKLANNETLLIIALGLCCAMAVLSSQVGFSSAFGAFVMGSILAETIEADKIIKLVEPVKNLFGAVFFVSVGMLVDPGVLVEYALPIGVLVLTILLGQMFFGSLGFFLSGESLKSAMKCGFSMAQIGEFSFIIASLGLSLGVIGKFLYPVVVAVSVITTFLTPYMIRFASPAYLQLESRLPKQWIRRLNHMTANQASVTAAEKNNWKSLLGQILIYVVINSILSAAIIAIMYSFFLPFAQSLLPDWLSNILSATLTILLISPFLRTIIMKKNHSEEVKALLTKNRFNRFPLIFIRLVRVVIAVSFVFYICNSMMNFAPALIISVALALVIGMIMSRRLKRHSIRLERLFVQNLRSRDIAAQVHGRKRPLYEGHLLDRNVHLAHIDVPENSLWAGKTLSELHVGKRFGVHLSSILRGNTRMNIPNGETVIFPGDKIQVIGNDEQLTAFNAAINSELRAEDPDIEKREMKLRRMIVSNNSAFCGQTLGGSGIRDKFNCMVVGIETGEENLSMVESSHVFEKGDIIWLVGEVEDIQRLMQVF